MLRWPHGGATIHPGGKSSQESERQTSQRCGIHNLHNNINIYTTIVLHILILSTPLQLQLNHAMSTVLVSLFEALRKLIPDKKAAQLPVYEATFNYQGTTHLPQHIDDPPGDGPGWYLANSCLSIVSTDRCCVLGMFST